MMRIEVALVVLEDFLMDENWHIREEVLKLISLIYLNTDSNYEFDQSPLLKLIAKTLDDKVAKVSYHHDFCKKYNRLE